VKGVRGVVLLVAVQLVLVVVYWVVEHRRAAPVPFAVETVAEAAPELVLRRDGAEVVPPTGPYLVHFWATWCAPCQEELPGLLDAAEAEGVPLLAVTDEAWPVVERYFDGAVPSAVVQDPTGAAAADWRVSGLPDTFVVLEGRLRHRMGGPRDWRTNEARAFLRDLGRER